MNKYGLVDSLSPVNISDVLPYLLRPSTSVRGDFSIDFLNNSSSFSRL